MYLQENSRPLGIEEPLWPGSEIHQFLTKNLDREAGEIYSSLTFSRKIYFLQLLRAKIL
ncbi:MAG: hypothetical protein ACR2OR_17430 [Hyphomicrobiales bacterium]